ncbi:MAG: copper chaperone PCu(A)C [Shewanella sp.]|nr:copper chaperone PCu(A)C [Shewanella sp.]MCF1429410.1 copper chaperone PCu(A)C [Shewanella sp.]MCF1439165.1 copper chaperone PCu(A)C [Shewanella sp.]MCF1456017.1 copper chaperone PCu(A)C [Shewanella sp.]
MEFMTLKLIFKQVLGGLILCSSAQLMAAQVQLTDGFIRAVPPSVPNSAAYLTLKNEGDATELVAVETSIAREAQLHTLIEEKGLVKMRQVPGFAIPTAGELQLAPAGDHIMLLGLKRPLKQGEEIELRLIFEDGSKQLVQLPVRKNDGQTQHHH